MGLYDTIIMAGPADALRCAHGHELREFQTKDLDPAMQTYYVWDGTLFKRAREDGEHGEHVRYELQGDGLLVTSQDRALPATAGELVVYTSCDACLPVLVESPHGWGGFVQEQHPWVQYVLRFEGSRVWERRPDRLESRDDVRKKHPNAIPDDDRVARRHFEQRAKKA